MNRERLRFWCCLALGVVSTQSAAYDSPVEIRLVHSGFRIRESAVIAKRTYLFPDVEEGGAIRIEGDGLTVDFQGARLNGASKGQEADAYTGKGLVIRGKNVTVKNANVHGYKIGIFAEDSPGLTLVNCDVSYNYRQRLKSTMEREDPSDWLYGHENDENQWLRYGAGIYLLRCPEAHVESCRARNGQNGLCLVRSDRCRVVDNDLSFLSGWGLAMWRSSECEVFNNKFDWCIRGYSHGVYSRGQDSAGILVYEQCHRNLFAYNSATHGGDGFFLYAGHETVQKTGEGGCNGNRLYRNDFSHAAANGIEATFSDGNFFVENILDECEHGVWAGYSSNTVIQGNTIRNCKNGVSIEHGRRNVITDNRISDAPLGVHLWWDEDKELLASAFGKGHGGCPSKTNVVARNRFERVKTAVKLVDDQESLVTGEEEGMKEVEGALLHLGGNVDGLRVGFSQAKVLNEGSGRVDFAGGAVEGAVPPPIDLLAKEPRLSNRQGKQDAMLPKAAQRGRQYIFVDEWGPYDFSDLRIFPPRIVGGDRALFQVFGPGAFRVGMVEGDVSVGPVAGRLPNKIRVESKKEGWQAFSVDVSGDRGVRKATGELFLAEWKIRYYRWQEPDDPRGDPEAWRRITSNPPMAETTTRSVNFTWGMESPQEGVPADRFATAATTKAPLPGGTWRVRTISDDGVRVVIDGKEVLANWTWHGPTEDAGIVELPAGEHEFRIEHFEIDGFAQLQFRLERVHP